MGKLSTVIIIGVLLLSATIEAFQIRQLPRGDLLAKIKDGHNGLDEMIKKMMLSKTGGSSEEVNELFSNNLLEMNAPADKVFPLLQRLIAEINQEQLTSDDIKYNQDQDCHDEGEFRKKNIKTAEATLNRAQEAKGRCDVTLTKASNLLAINVQIQDFKRKEMDSLKRIRNQQREMYAFVSQQRDEAVGALDQFLVLLEQLGKENAPSNATAKQVSNVTTTLLQLYSESRDSLVSQILDRTTVLMTQQPKKVSREEIKQLKSLVITLKKQLDDGFVKLTREENRELESYNIQIGKINKIQNHLVTQEHNLRLIISDMNNCEDEEGAKIQVQTGRLRRNNALLKAAIEMCKAFAEEYDVQTKSRQHSIQLYNKIYEWLKAYFKKHPAARQEEIPLETKESEKVENK